MKLPIEFADLFGAFAKHRVRYMIVGGYAVALHGAPRFTKDLDVFLDPDARNRRQLANALAEFGAPQGTLDALQSLTGLDVAWMGNPPLRIDFMIQIPGVDYDTAERHKQWVAWGELQVAVIGKNELIVSKVASGRPQDLLDVSEVRKLDEPDGR
jgi:hypothetical protein